VSRVALLDVNVLVALFDPDHVHHEVAHDWFADHGRAGWATCPVTESGFLRILSNPGYGSAISTPGDLAGRLRKFCRTAGHRLWPMDISLLDEARFDLSKVGGHRQLTDVHLLGLAHAHGGCLATFDRAVPLGAVRGADAASLQVIAPTE
jgi:uncharacterized protein